MRTLGEEPKLNLFLTGMGTLIPICPASHSNWNLRAALPDLVKIAAPLPQALELMKSMADWRSGLLTTTRTGPKISSL